jgi:hypothetical protein
VVRFHEIADLDISRTDTFFEDSVITIELNDGRPVSFPVSGEADGDQRFFEAIQDRKERAGGDKAIPKSTTSTQPVAHAARVRAVSTRS